MERRPQDESRLQGLGTELKLHAACRVGLRGRTVRGYPVSPQCSVGTHRRARDIIQLGTADPPLRHPGPHGLVFTAVGELGHELAFGGKSKEFLRRIHELGLPRAAAT
jgi:hypothetical protein